MMLLLLFVVACVSESLLELVYSEHHSQAVVLQEINPGLYSSLADVSVISSTSWDALTRGHCPGRALLVELADFCLLPDRATLARINTPFILFGPFYRWHHVNFGAFTELDTAQGAYIFESRLSNKLAQCNGTVTVDDIRALLDHRALLWWVAQQHVTASVQHEKIRVQPLGFGYAGYRMDDQPIEQWKRLALDVLKRKTTTVRQNLLLVSFNVHVNLFGDSGDDPRSIALRALRSIPSLAPFATLQTFGNTRAFMEAMANSKFVLSPWGWGPDCFRHYEAIALGAIPIVLSDWATDRALVGLPVLIVDSWAELNASMLLAAHRRIDAQRFELERLTRHYWIETLFRAPCALLT